MSGQTKPCDRCGITCTIGGNTGPIVVCRDCRSSDAEWLRMVGADARPAPSREKCGSMAGWNIHRRTGERVCVACWQAQLDYQRQYRSRKKVAAS